MGGRNETPALESQNCSEAALAPLKPGFHNMMKFQPQDEFFLQQEGHGTRSFSGFA